MSQVHSHEIRVRYADTDAMGVVYHANYLAYCETGRVEFMRSSGVPYTEFEAAGLFVPVVEAHLRYKEPARFDEVVRVETRIDELSPAKVRFAYRIVRIGDERLLAEGYTLHGFMSKAGRPVALPKAAPELFDRLKSVLPQG